jgi:hypothetical protein
LIGAHVTSEADALTRAQWLVQALDPCVQYSLSVRSTEVGHA